jgi:poly(3-hydroxybutyrate) depolymerase
MLYAAYQTHEDLLWPYRTFVREAASIMDDARFGVNTTKTVRDMTAACETFALSRITHKRPPFGIDSVKVGDQEVAVHEQGVFRTPFATLLHLKKDHLNSQPRVLIVAPMSGHFATLLRETVRTMLADHDVYITDWHNARDVPLLAGRFGLDEYTEHIMSFTRWIGEGTHIVAICQPCVSALAAVALMSEDADPATPASLTLMAGPIDCRISATAVNKLAITKPIEWFEKNLITNVPMRYLGAFRRVYPGFVQLSAFMNMNLERHKAAFRGYYDSLAAGDFEKAEATRTFYEEYFAVADLAAEFYLETVQKVFQEFALAKGELEFRGRKVNPAAIRRTALVTVEGERDDICGIGQTLAAQDLCVNLKQYLRTHYVQPGVGHYGVFSGRRWNSHIYPVVRDVIHVSR